MIPPSVEKAREDLKELRASMAWAFAMGHGCSIDGGHPTLMAIRQEHDRLLAIVSEWK